MLSRSQAFAAAFSAKKALLNVNATVNAERTFTFIPSIVCSNINTLDNLPSARRDVKFRSGVRVSSDTSGVRTCHSLSARAARGHVLLVPCA